MGSRQKRRQRISTALAVALIALISISALFTLSKLRIKERAEISRIRTLTDTVNSQFMELQKMPPAASEAEATLQRDSVRLKLETPLNALADLIRVTPSGNKADDQILIRQTESSER